MVTTGDLCVPLTEQNSQSLLTDHDTFLFDCDGVLWNSPYVFPGAMDLLHYLKKMGKRLFFVTNNSTKTQDDCASFLNQNGYPATLEQIICTPWLTAQYLKRKNFKGKLYVVGMPSMRYELEREGFEICGGIGPDPVNPDLKKFDSTALKFDEQVDCVISALDLHISYNKIVKAATYLKRDNVEFLATNDDASLPQNNEVVVPGAGSVLASIEKASGRTPTILGKPHPAMFEIIRSVFPEVDPKRTVMIGDRVETDISFGNKHGTTTLLVFSGATSYTDLNNLRENVDNQTANQDLLPNYCVKDVEQFLNLLKSNIY